MAVDGVSGAISGLATGSGGGSTNTLSNVDFNTFLKLLTTQLKNQDPLNPLDGTEFTGQIAQFSSLEQQVKSNSLLEKLSTNQDYGQQALAVSTIGKEVLIPGNGFDLVSGSADFGYKLEGLASNVDIDIIDSTGRTVKTMKGQGAEGSHTMAWDGKDNSGVQLSDGRYTLRVQANDTDGTKVASSPYTYDVVMEVNTSGGEVSVTTFDKRTAKYADVLSVRAFNG